MVLRTEMKHWCMTAVAVFAFGIIPAAAEGYYFVGNSLTFGLSHARIGWLAEQNGAPMEYGFQGAGDAKLTEHWFQRRELGTPVWKTNRVETADYGRYENALSAFTWDALVLQPYMNWLETKDATPDTGGFISYGDRDVCNQFIGYARGNNPDTNVATDRIYVYGAWPNALGIHYRNPERPAANLDPVDPDFGNSYTGFTFKDFYEQPYDSSGGGQFGLARETTPNTDFLYRLVDSLNTDNPDLPEPVRLIPAGAVLAQLDSLIRNDALPGIEAYFIRHAGYYDTARFIGQSKSQYNAVPQENQPFDKNYGVMNFYADAIHMNDQPHVGAEEGTVGAYAAALTVYTVLTGTDPRGTAVSAPGEGWDRLDPITDSALVATIQQVVWDVVTAEPRSGISVPSSVSRHNVKTVMSAADIPNPVSVRMLRRSGADMLPVVSGVSANGVYLVKSGAGWVKRIVVE